MSPGLRLLLPLLVAGCASQLLTVPDSDWQTVPAAQRAALDRQHEAAVASARAEIAGASAGLAEAQRTQPAAPAPAAAAPSPRPVAVTVDDDPWAAAMRDHDRTRRAAFTRVQDAKAAWLRTKLTWRERQLESASARLDMVVLERELTRARAIDRNLLGDDHYETAPLRGQFSQAQRRWYTAATAATRARNDFESASTTLASAKEAYAQLMRDVPLSSSVALQSPDDEPPRLQLPGWSLTRSDIRRKRGLRRFLDETAAWNQLRGVGIRLTAAARPARLPSSTATAASTERPAPQQASAADKPSKPEPRAPKPARPAEAPPVPRPTPTTAPATAASNPEHPERSAPIPAPRPAPPPTTPAVAKPVERPSSPVHSRAFPTAAKPTELEKPGAPDGNR